MNTFNRYPDIDVRAMRALVIVLEEQSVSKAAVRLGVSQSAVSHTLERLRVVFDDPLFVRDGRGIRPTARARVLGEAIRQILEQLVELTTVSTFDPRTAELRMRVAANDFQRDILLPEVLRTTRSVIKRLQLEVIPSGIPSAEILNKDQVDLLITPHPPLGSDIFQMRVFHDQRVCFYDPNARDAPRALSSYTTAKHISLRFGAGDQPSVDARLENDGIYRDIEIEVASFSAIPTFMAGTELVATLPSLLERGLMKHFASCPLPFDSGTFDMYMVWHRRVHRDPAHRWFRAEVAKVGESLSPKAAIS